jgi:ribosomal protein L7/L12
MRLQQLRRIEADLVLQLELVRREIENTSCELVGGTDKVKTIKAIRAFFGLDLRKAFDMYDNMMVKGHRIDLPEDYEDRLREAFGDTADEFLRALVIE